MKIRKKENSSNIVCFHPERARPRKPFQSQLSELSLCQRIESKVSCTRLNLRQFYLYLVLDSTFVFKLFKQASHYPKDNGGISLNLQAVYP